MTEAKWFASLEAHDLLAHVLHERGATRSKLGRRRLRLFACASCRLFCDPSTDPRSLAAIEYMERFAEREATGSEIRDIQNAAHKALREIETRSSVDRMREVESPALLAAQATFYLADKRANWCVFAALKTSLGISDNIRRESKSARDPKWAEYRHAMCHALRDIFGNPFREITFNKKWRTNTAVTVARQMYESRDFGAMPILADALQDAGCEDEAILMHCRDANQPHVRGCWVCDLVLGKA